MMTSEIVRTAYALPQQEREAYLDRVCFGQPGLRAEVEKLLQALVSEQTSTLPGEWSADATSLLASSPIDSKENPTGPLNGTEGTSEFASSGSAFPQKTDGDSADTVASMIAGRYQRVTKIGEGGMGEVWIAQQFEPVKRRVALKLIKSGMDTKTVLTRFEQERQALALMDHPNIAKVFDAGKTPTGQPFFVMELVDGQPLNRYCDEKLLTLENRLALFVPICQAVQHAHQKGIVHRDLKPANVLVTEVDVRPVPKVIDFGVAKATAGKLTEHTMDTQLGAVIGTLEYMSPEQAGGAIEDIDTRADIYSLGVILYELLTGLKPIDRKQLHKAALTEIIRIIREVEPSKPSTRLSTSESLPSVASVRQIEPRKLTAALRGELDWIVMKCLEKSRDRRYETANGLARDIQRFLSNEPVEARPASTLYNLRKLIARNKVTTIAGGLILLSLVGGIVGTSLALADARVAREAADDASERATAKAAAESRERRRAELAEAETRKRAEELERIAVFQATQLSGIKPSLMGGKLRDDILRRRRVSLESAKIEQAEIDRHLGELETELQGVNFTSVALDALDENIFDRALKTIDEKFSDQPVIQARLLQTLADTMLQLGLVEQALQPQERAIEIRRKSLGDAHSDTQQSIEGLSSLLIEQGKFEAAISFGREVLALREAALGPEHTLTLRSRVGLANALVMVQQFEETDAILEKAVADARRILGPDHEITMAAQKYYGLSLFYQGKWKEAEPLLRESVEGGRRIFGMEDMKTQGSCNYLFQTLENLGRFDESAALIKEASEASRKALGDDHPSTQAMLSSYATSLNRQKKHDEAEAIYREVLVSSVRVFGVNNASTLTSMNNLAHTLNVSGRHAEAEPLARECLEKSRRIRGDEHRETLVALNTLGQSLAGQGKLAESVPYWRENLETSRRVLGDDHPDTIIFSYNLGGLLSDLDRDAEAEPYLLSSFEKCKGMLGVDHPNTQVMQSLYGSVLVKLKKYDEAEPILQNAIAFAEKNMQGSNREFRMKAALGSIRLAQEKRDEAESLFKAAYEGMVANVKSIRRMERQDLYRAAQNLASIYESSGRENDAAKIRTEIEAIMREFEQTSPEATKSK